MRATAPIALLTACLFPLGPQPADAASLGLNRAETIVHVADLGHDSTGAFYSFCQVNSTQQVLFVPITRRAERYVIAEGACNAGTAMKEVTPQDVAYFIDQGHIPAEVPIAPHLSMRDVLVGHSLWGLLLLGLLAGLASQIRLGNKRKTRQEILGIEEPAVFAFIDAMLHALACDGEVADEEVDYILGVARDVAGLDYARDHILTTLAYLDPLKSTADFKQFGKGLSQEQRAMILDGVLSVVFADGVLRDTEQKFIKRMTKGLNLQPAAVETAVNRVRNAFDAQNAKGPGMAV